MGLLIGDTHRQRLEFCSARGAPRRAQQAAIGESFKGDERPPAELRASPHAAQVDWDAVERLSRYGGIRIEDDVACRPAGEAPENRTRDAFAIGL